jgi:hypothetical protein
MFIFCDSKLKEKEKENHMLKVTLRDRNVIIGSAKISLHELKPEIGILDKWFPLFQKSKNTQTAEIHLLLSNGVPVLQRILLSLILYFVSFQIDLIHILIVLRSHHDRKKDKNKRAISIYLTLNRLT